MEVSKCKKCSEEIKKEAKVCKHCGARQGISIYVVALIAFIVLLVGIGVLSEEPIIKKEKASTTQTESSFSDEVNLKIQSVDMLIDLPTITTLSFDEMKQQYGEPDEENQNQDFVNGEWVPTTKFYNWSIEGYNIEIHYGNDGIPYTVLVISSDFTEREFHVLFGELGLQYPTVVPSGESKLFRGWDDYKGWKRFSIYSSHSGSIAEKPYSVSIDITEELY